MTAGINYEGGSVAHLEDMVHDLRLVGKVKVNWVWVNSPKEVDSKRKIIERRSAQNDI